MIIETLEDIESLKESFDIECKLASGKNGEGQLPKDFWPSYSAFANSYGGDIFLGIKEKKGEFFLHGVQNVDKVIDELFSGLNNTNKVNISVISDDNVSCIDIGGRTVIHIHIPRAKRVQRPIFINNNPLTGTYKRRSTGDQLCREEEVKRFLAEQVEESRDNIILKGFDLRDINLETLHAFRNLMASRSPSHPWLLFEDKQFLTQLGAYRRDREHDYSGLTIAGLLMFGNLVSIQEAFPNYLLDYQERGEDTSVTRWLDRVTLDGTWSGNLFDFYRKVYSKLISELKVPFSLELDQRKGENIVHVSLREALVNCLVHADYSDRASILVIKKPEMFSFRNPGLMRISIEQAIAGGVSDCRNRTIHKMFLLIGLGERAGSGISKIFHGWKSQNWVNPHLYEEEVPDRTFLDLHMGDMIDEKTTSELTSLLGEAYLEATADEKYILATAHLEAFVTHKRLLELTSQHPHDLSVILSNMVKKNMLSSSGRGKGKVYHVVGKLIAKPDGRVNNDDIIVKVPAGVLSNEAGVLSDEAGVLRNEAGVLRNENETLDTLNLSALKYESNVDVWKKLEKIAEPIANTKRVSDLELMESVILELCKDYFLTIQALQILLKRDGNALRRKYLTKMVKEKKLHLAYPAVPNSPKQAYSVNEPPTLVTYK